MRMEGPEWEASPHTRSRGWSRVPAGLDSALRTEAGPLQTNPLEAAARSSSRRAGYRIQDSALLYPHVLVVRAKMLAGVLKAGAAFLMTQQRTANDFK